MQLVPRLEIPEAQSENAEVRLTWSRWTRYQSSFALALAPAQPGVFALAEEVLAPGESAQLGQKRMLAVFHVDETDDLARAFTGLFSSTSPWRERLASGRCFLRVAVSTNAAERHAACAALRRWLTASTDNAAAIAGAREPHVTPRQPAPADRQKTEIVRPKSFPAGF